VTKFKMCFTNLINKELSKPDIEVTNLPTHAEAYQMRREREALQYSRRGRPLSDEMQGAEGLGVVTIAESLAAQRAMIGRKDVSFQDAILAIRARAYR
jgi:hypothetical protein